MTTAMIPATSQVPAAAIGLLLACLEGLQGRRALHQLRPRMQRDAFESLIQHRTPLLEDATLGNVRIQMPHAGAVEATASIAWRGRWVACAVRLDATRGSTWVCTALQVVRPT